MVYIDPPYGIKYGSNFQPFVNKREVKDRKDEDLTQEGACRGGRVHLAPYPDELMAKTVEAMKEINPDYLIPMHCTGSRTIMAIQRQMHEKLIVPSTVTRVVFGA
jgi:hypothetical protein